MRPARAVAVVFRRYMRTSASGPLNRRSQAQLKAGARPKAAEKRRPSTGRGTSGPSGPGCKESRESPRRSPWQTGLWQGGLLSRGRESRESQTGVAPAVRVTRSTSPSLPGGRSQLRGSRAAAGSNSREVEVLKAQMQSIRRMQLETLTKPHLRGAGRFSNACREPAPRDQRSTAALPIEFIGCQEAVETAAAQILQRHWRKQRRRRGPCGPCGPGAERRCNSLRAIEKFSPQRPWAHLAAARIQRAWRVWNWRRAFVVYSEQIGWLGHFDWLLRHRKVFGTELASAEDAAVWSQEKRHAPPDAEIDPWGHRELRRHLAAQSSAVSGAAPETAAEPPLKARAHCVVGAHLSERLRRSAMKPSKDDSKLCKTISSLEPPAQRPRIMTQRYSVALGVGAGAAAALLSPRCDFRSTLEAPAAPAGTTAVPILRPAWTSSQAVLAQAPCGPLLRCRARTPQPTPRPMVRLLTQSPRWAHSPSPSSRASVAHAAVALAMPWKLPGTVPCR